jgi:hypothetical protein
MRPFEKLVMGFLSLCSWLHNDQIVLEKLIEFQSFTPGTLVSRRPHHKINDLAEYTDQSARRGIPYPHCIRKIDPGTLPCDRTLRIIAPGRVGQHAGPRPALERNADIALRLPLLCRAEAVSLV